MRFMLTLSAGLGLDPHQNSFVLDYALKAFDYDVTDYLHKPITLARFEASVKRAVTKYEQINRVDEDEEHIFVKSNLKKRKVILNDIKWIEALGDYIKQLLRRVSEFEPPTGY